MCISLCRFFKSKIFESLNENQLNNDKVTKNLENNISILKENNYNLNKKYINLQMKII